MTLVCSQRLENHCQGVTEEEQAALCPFSPLRSLGVKVCREEVMKFQEARGNHSAVSLTQGLKSGREELGAGQGL